ncbi:MAG: 30S ribosome-binding factor RbfA [Christensenellaceae bacterium]|jgi:ribosome-binding factor A
MSTRRTARIDNELKRILGEALIVDMKDPRISKMTNVLRVEATSDLQYAKVYVSIYDTPEQVKSTMEALVHAEPFLRSRINDKLKIRRIPVLQFILDTSIEYSAKISKLIDEVTAKDKEHAKTDTEDRQ